MFEEEIVKLSNQEQKQFAQVVNNLLSQSYIVREYYDSREKMIKMSNDIVSLKDIMKYLKNILNIQVGHWIKIRQLVLSLFVMILIKIV